MLTLVFGLLLFSCLLGAVQTVQTIGRSGKNLTDLAVAADGAGDKWTPLTPANLEFIAIINGDSGSHVVTLKRGSGKTIDGSTLPDPTVTVAAGKTMLIGPFPPGYYNDGNGQVGVTYDGVTSVKICVFTLGP